MEGLAAAGSVFAVVSIAVQLTDSIQKLCDFWESVQDAPEEIQCVIDDLKVLQLVVDELRHNEELSGPRAIVTQSIQGCQRKINTLLVLVNELVPNFASSKRVVRKWTALKGAMRNGKIQKFKLSLEEAKSTLMLASQSASIRSHNNHFETHQRTILTLSQRVETMHMQSATQITTSFPSVAQSSSSPMSSAQLEAQIKRVASSISNPMLRYGFISATTSAMVEILEQTQNLEESRSQSGQNKQKSSVTRLYGRQDVVRTLFGTVHTRRRCEGVVFDEDTQRWEVDEDYREEIQIILHPAAWLIKCGLAWALQYRSDNSGDLTTFNLSIQRAVPDDALHFKLCRQGNVIEVRNLLSARKASVNDVDSRGDTLLHIASYRCDYDMIETLIRAGSDVGAVNYEMDDPFYMACHKTFERTETSAERIEVLRLLSSYPRALDAMETENFAAQLGNLIWADFTAERYNLCRGVYSATWFIHNFITEISEYLQPGMSPISDLYAFAALLKDDEVVKQLLDINRELKEFFFDFGIMWGAWGYLPDTLPIEATKGEIMLVKAGANLHKHIPGGTASLVAVSHPKIFRHWQQIILGCGINLERFVQDEMAASSMWAAVGWTKDSLCELFMADAVAVPADEDLKSCQRCFHHSNEFKPLWWHEHVESIMVRGMPSSTYDATTLGTEADAKPEPIQTYYRRRVIFPIRLRRERESIARTGYCMSCLKRIEEIRKQREEYCHDEGDSPFLLSF